MLPACRRLYFLHFLSAGRVDLTTPPPAPVSSDDFTQLRPILVWEQRRSIKGIASHMIQRQAQIYMWLLLLL